MSEPKGLDDPINPRKAIKNVDTLITLIEKLRSTPPEDLQAVAEELQIMDEELNKKIIDAKDMSERVQYSAGRSPINVGRASILAGVFDYVFGISGLSGGTTMLISVAGAFATAAAFRRYYAKLLNSQKIKTQELIAMHQRVLDLKKDIDRLVNSAS